MCTVAVTNICKVYPGHSASDESVRALDGITFRVENQEFCSILGHSGCGKTTLLTLMAAIGPAAV